MERQRATRQIERIVHAIEDEQFPAHVRELHVFGSYARGALNPGDLDLILIHDQPSPDLLNLLRDEIVEKHGEDDFYWPRGTSPERRFEASMRAVMRKPGEKMDILLGTSMEKIDGMGENIAKAHKVLVWSDSDPNWQAKLGSIRIDPNAGRHERAHFADLRRFNADVRQMLNVTEAIKRGFLKLTRINAGEVEPVLNPLYEHWHDWWIECKVMGKDSLKLMKHGMWWLQQQRGQQWQKPSSGRGGVMCSEDHKYAVYFGNPPLYVVWDVCHGKHRYVRVCLIPHFKKGHPHEIFVFEKGKKTGQKELEQIMRRV